MSELTQSLQSNRMRIAVAFVLLLAFLLAISGMDTDDWVLTLIRGLSTGALIFLVASGLSLIFGLLDVLNLAHGELFMLGAYVGWTVYIRPDTFIDVLTPVLLIAVGFALTPIWESLLSRLHLSPTVARIWPWIGLIAGALVLFFSLRAYHISIWDPEVYAQSPVTIALNFSQGTLTLPEAPVFETSPILVMVGILLGSIMLALSVAGLSLARREIHIESKISLRPFIYAGALLLVGLIVFFLNDSLTEFVVGLGTNLRFLLAILVAIGTGLLIGAMIETSLIRPLYSRPMYQIMMTLGLSFIGIELVRTIWGQPEFTMAKPALFDGGGEFCPAASIGDLIKYQCSTFMLFDSRVRTYNEIFIILVGVVVLVAIWLLLQRTRLGMIIRAGVQDSDMVQALGINVRRIFTLVFALGAGLASLGGVLAAPSIGLSINMGTQFLLLALIALGIGGLTSFPGAAIGAILVGLMQQFMIKYGQIGINIPFLEEPFKPTPPLVPASVMLLMVVILLLLPNGLLGRKE
ncbi:MAG: branched-chain amino acid ABC transporter permease [Chloroflexota bacterium]